MSDFRNLKVYQDARILNKAIFITTVQNDLIRSE
jgi:hypothetical protein